MRLARQMSSALLLLGIVPSGLSPAAPLPAAERHGVLVTVGEVAPDRATIWLRGDRSTPLRLRYAAADEPEPAQEGTIVPSPARDNTARAVLSGLSPGTRYVYEATQDDATASGSFITAPARDADASVRLAWSGDLGGGGYCRDVEDGYRIFDALARRHPDFFLFIGDTIYADQVCGKRPHVPGADYVAKTLADFHSKHRYNRADHVLQDFFRTTAVYATWDDHEVRNNFAGPTEPLMPIALQAMLDYWPIEGPPEEPRRLYRSVRWGRHLEVFILDTRQYRSDNAEPDGPGKSMLGPAQREWLQRGLAASDATWKLVVTSVPLGMFTGGRDSDSWSGVNLFGFPRAAASGFVHERNLLLGFVREQGIRNVVFLSGDVHHAELIRHEPAPGFVVHELVAGPLAARQGYPRFLDRSLHSRSLGSAGFVTNFGELVVDGATLQARIFDASDTLRASLRISTDGSVSRGQADPPRPRRRQASPISARRASALNAAPASSTVSAP
jgi:alkaline phosphatase D